MLTFNEIKSVYFIGIGGIGMSALARYFRAMGIVVGGYDRTPSALTHELESEDIAIHYEESVDMVPEVFKNLQNRTSTLIVYTPAVSAWHKELIYFREHGYEILKRAEVLGIIAESKKSLAVAGTHGKTTTTTMVSHLYRHSRFSCCAFLGGISKNYNTNFLLDANSDFIVVEADEYDRSFLRLTPDAAIITSMDADHLDIYGSMEAIRESFEAFVCKIKKGGKLVYKKGLPLTIKNPDIEVFTYSLDDPTADYHAKNIRIENGIFHFDWVALGEVHEGFELGVPGKINVENAVAALAMAHFNDVKLDKMKMACQSFSGVKRRFDVQLKTDKMVYIDDYAHHPAELNACITSIRELYPDKEITGVFQPHLFSRTKDFYEDFAKSLSLLDVAIVLPIYPARELPMEGVSSLLIYDRVKSNKKLMLFDDGLLKYLKEKDVEVLITMGAGNIDKLVYPIKDLLMKKNSHLQNYD